MLSNLLYLLIIFVVLCKLNNGEIFPECEDEGDETFVAVMDNCSQAIYCKGEQSSIVECSQSTPYFSEEDSRCYKESDVCGNRPFSVVSTTTTSTAVTPKIPVNVATPPSIGSTTDGTPSTTTSTTTSSTTSPSTSTASTSSSSTTKVNISSSTSSLSSSQTSPKPPTGNLWCPPQDDAIKPLFLPLPQSCSQYYLCYHGQATVLQCPNGLYFDENLQSCNTAQLVQCQWNNDLKPRDQCLPHIVDVYPHPTNCNYYYLCEHGYLMVMQCPFDMAWDYKERKCLKKSKANCYNKEKDD